MEVSYITENDIGHLIELQPPDWSDIQNHFSFYIRASFCHPLKLVIDERIAAVGAAMFFGETGWVGHIIVLPEYRGKGYGIAITDALLNVLRSLGTTTVSLIATDAGKGVYSKLGFVPEMEYVFFRGKPVGGEVHSDNIFLFEERMKGEIFALDKNATGEGRQELLAEHLQACMVYVRNNKVEGFYLPTLGEGLIVAENAQAGIGLMKMRTGNAEKIVFPEGNDEAINYLLQNKFEKYSSLTRMYLGNKLRWAPGAIYNRISGSFG